MPVTAVPAPDTILYGSTPILAVIPYLPFYHWFVVLHAVYALRLRAYRARTRRFAVLRSAARAPLPLVGFARLRGLRSAHVYGCTHVARLHTTHGFTPRVTHARFCRFWLPFCQVTLPLLLPVHRTPHLPLLRSAFGLQFCPYLSLPPRFCRTCVQFYRLVTVLDHRFCRIHLHHTFAATRFAFLDYHYGLRFTAVTLRFTAIPLQVHRVACRYRLRSSGCVTRWLGSAAHTRCYIVAFTVYGYCILLRLVLRLLPRTQHFTFGYARCRVTLACTL